MRITIEIFIQIIDIFYFQKFFEVGNLKNVTSLGTCAPVLRSAFRAPERNALGRSAGARSAKILKGSLERGAQ